MRQAELSLYPGAVAPEHGVDLERAGKEPASVDSLERVAEVKKKSEEYLRFRRARARVTEICREILGIMDRIEKLRRRNPEMKTSDRSETVPMLYERNDSYVIEAFRQGEFDYLEGVGEVSEADFFRAIAAKKYFT